MQAMSRDTGHWHGWMTERKAEARIMGLWTKVEVSQCSE